jgi:hypothetical protein
MVEFADQSAALRVRDAVTTLAQKAMNETRPDSSYGQVVSIDHDAAICKVVFPGATEPTQVNLGMLARPHDATGGIEGAVGALVEIAGSPGNYRVIDVLFGSAHLYKPVLDTASVGSLTEKHATAFSKWVNEAGAVGNQTHVGRFENTGSLLGEGAFYARMIVEQPLSSDIMKVYEFSLASTAGLWRPLAEDFSSGSNATWFNAEIKIDATGFDLRLRRCFGTGGNYRVTLWIYGADYVLNPDGALAEMSDAQPTMDTAYAYPNSDKDGSVRSYPFFNALRNNYQVRPVQQLNSGGTITWDGSRLNWDGTFQCVVGMGWHNSLGVLSIAAPASGTFLTVHGSATVSTNAVNTSGVYMQVESRTTLYYEPILGGDGTSASGRFHLVCASEEFTIPAHWIFIAEAGSQTVSPTLRLCTGELIDHWKDINLAAASAGETGAFPQWKWNSRGMVALRGGLHRTSATFVNGDTMMTMPVQARPSIPRWCVGQVDNAVVGRAGGFRVQSDGTVTNNTGPAANQPNTFYFDGVIYSV